MTCHHGPDTCGPDGCPFARLEEALEALAAAGDDWAPVGDGRLVQPCGCTYLDVEGDWIDACESPACQAAFDREIEEEDFEFRFYDVVYEGLLAELDHYRPISDIYADAYRFQGQTELMEAAVEEAAALCLALTRSIAPMPWFPWLAEYADSHDDLRLPWPFLLDAAYSANEYIRELRPMGLHLSDDSHAEVEVYNKAQLRAVRERNHDPDGR